jgi:hypothetical protein
VYHAWGDDKFIKISGWNTSEGRNHFEDSSVVVRIILEWILEK